jgi:hypothetical protein
MSVSGIGSSSNIDIAQMAASFFNKADVNGDGGIDKSELTTMMANGPDGGKGTFDVDNVFAVGDANGDGTIDQTENENQLKKIGEEMQTRSAQGGGKPPASGAPPSGGASGGSSSSSKVYDSRDTNKDGTVSAQEAFTYSLIHPETSQGSRNSDSVKLAIDDLLNQVKTGTKYGSEGFLNASTTGTQSLFSLLA